MLSRIGADYKMSEVFLVRCTFPTLICRYNVPGPVHIQCEQLLLAMDRDRVTCFHLPDPYYRMYHAARRHGIEPGMEVKVHIEDSPRAHTYFHLRAS